MTATDWVTCSIEADVPVPVEHRLKGGITTAKNLAELAQTLPLAAPSLHTEEKKAKEKQQQRYNGQL